MIISGLDMYPTPPSYTVSLVDLTGKTIRTATAANRSWSEIHFTDDGYGHPTSLPQVSASNNRVYYLDGESAVRFVALSGSAGLAHTLPAGTLTHAAFAVSPDDQRIAVTVVDYPSVSMGSIHTRLYVEDLLGGGHHVDLFESRSAVEWPIGWHAGQLVIGVAGGPYGQNPCDICAYRAYEYHVADATTATRLATICSGPSGAVSFGLPTPAGIECEVHYGDSHHQSLLESWDGSSRTIPSDVCGVGGPVSPDGRQIATVFRHQQPDGGCGGGESITLVDLSGKRVSTNVGGTAQGWVDSRHLVFQTPQGKLALFDTSSGAVSPMDTPGAMVGVLPGNLG
ncbi:MAG TPA: hypothetical protein VHK65_03360 [Candidatus Dormibacteraeota bacterium]|nr:hypothetical protein [Candidatus Dormibacteraeota bacterium]